MRRINEVMPYLFPVFVMGVVLLYYNFNPNVSNLSLRCPWKLLTQTDCPACGFQRALYSLLHGDFECAIRHNYFFVISLPYAFLSVLCSWYNYKHVFDGLKRVVFHRYTLWTYIVLYFAWWILRNVVGL